MRYLVTFGIGFLLSIFITSKAFAVNEYLQGSGGHCQSASVNPFIEYNQRNNGSVSSGSWQDQDESGWRVGINLSIPLGSTCTKKYKETMLTNELLKQQLEMLKLCARYKGLDLGPEFAEVRRKCADVNKRAEAKKIKLEQEDD
mgnify:CR=1 FL=1|tara:strand:- start:1211 stop:1642 length:432 start_codon:yes stop_codon:yes gene_type:complete